MRSQFGRCRATAVFALWVGLAVSCRSAGTLRDPALEEQRQVAEMFRSARADMEKGVTELVRLSTAMDTAGVAGFMPELARRDTLYRKLIQLRRELDPGLPASLSGRVDIRSKPPRLDISPAPLFEPFRDGRTWMLQGYLIYRFGHTPHVLIVPAGFVTDLASVPDVAEPLLPRNGEYSTAAIIHDYLYWTQSCTREQSDNLMSIVMKETGVAPWKELLIYGAVRLAGQRAWDSDREHRASGTLRIVDVPWDRAPSEVDWDILQATLKETRSGADVYPPVSPQVCALGSL
ncbi:MAG: DUF1353 domain-containing protein [Gemmatimonadaceae bacterium]